MKNAPHAGIYMSDVRRHSDAASVKRLMETQWISEWEDAWQDLHSHPEAWLDYRDFKLANNRLTCPDFKPRDPASEFVALWLNPMWDNMVAGLRRSPRRHSCAVKGSHHCYCYCCECGLVGLAVRPL